MCAPNGYRQCLDSKQGFCSGDRHTSVPRTFVNVCQPLASMLVSARLACLTRDTVYYGRIPPVVQMIRDYINPDR